jgi:hypothetical protein
VINLTTWDVCFLAYLKGQTIEIFRLSLFFINGLHLSPFLGMRKFFEFDFEFEEIQYWQIQYNRELIGIIYDGDSQLWASFIVKSFTFDLFSKNSAYRI